MDTGKIGKQRTIRENPPAVGSDRGPTLHLPQPATPVMRIAAAMAEPATELPKVYPGRWWRLGRHRVFCGPADRRFAAHVPEAPLALCEARAPAATQISEVTSDWLSRRAAVMALLLDNAALLTTCYPGEFVYRRTVAALAAGADAGGETWYPVVLFAREAHALRIPDVLRLAADPLADGALRADLAVQLLEHLTLEGDPVLAPALGDGATLFAAEATGRICWGAEPDPEQCGRLIRAWETLTGETAVPIPALSNRVA